jgi:SAM-dependent methyltransferase
MRLLYEDIVHEEDHYNVYACASCGHGVTSPFPPDAALSALYADMNYRDKGKRFVKPLESIVRRFRLKRFKEIGRYSRGKRLLDIGCGRGLMLKTAQQAGWEVHGTEVNDDAAYHARELLGLDVRTGELEEAGFKEGTFDVITAWHVLEHLKDPQRTLAASRALLADEGVLVIEVPNFSSLQARLSGRHWFHLDVPFHLHHFTRRSIEIALESAGFTVVKTGQFSLEFGPYGFLQSVLNIICPTRNYLYDILRKKRLRGASGYPLMDIIITALLLPILVPVSFVASAFESAVGRGTTVRVFARKAATA